MNVNSHLHTSYVRGQLAMPMQECRIYYMTPPMAYKFPVSKGRGELDGRTRGADKEEHILRISLTRV